MSDIFSCRRNSSKSFAISTLIRVKLKRVVSNNVLRFSSGGNSYYEKFADGRVKCIDEEIPFEIPRNWEWARLGCVVEINPRNRVDESSQAGFIPMAYIDAGYGNHFRFDVRKWEELKSGFTHLADGDVAFAKITPCFQNRKSMILAGLPNGIAGGTTELNVLRVFGETLNREFLLYFIKSHYFIGEAVFKGTAGQQRVRTGYTESKLIPIPPFSEQRRIVGKINEVLPVAEKYELSQNHLDCLNSLIRERLKKSILQEAIQGKLVHQDSQEGSASELLVRIHNEKQKLLSEGKLRKKDIVDSVIYKGEDSKYYEKVGSKVLDISDEIPFDIPDSWQWVRLGFLFAHNTGKALNRADTDGVLKKYLTTSNVYWNRFDFAEVREMFFADSEVEKCTIRKGDLLVCEGGDIGRAAIWSFEYEICIQNHIHRLRAYYPVSTEFYYYVFELYKGIGHIGGKGIGIQGLSSGALHNLVFPLPPVQEQERIVLKIREMSRFL